MDIRELYENVQKKWLAIGAVLILCLLYAFNDRLAKQAANAEKACASLAETKRQSAEYLAEMRAQRDLKVKAMKKMKNALTDVAKTKRVTYEAGLSLQEEKRLLEKQIEIMTTYLEVDEESKKIHLMRGEQKLQSFEFPYAPLRVMGNDPRKPQALYKITAKERVASPERSKTEKTAGGLNWEPPQEGVSSRDSALGEFVIYTDGALILHAPPAKKEQHEAYPHLCAGLTTYSAKKLYNSVFIGNKLVVKAQISAKPAVAKAKSK